LEGLPLSGGTGVECVVLTVPAEIALPLFHAGFSSKCSSYHVKI
jgi:hypothetical protein